MPRAMPRDPDAPDPDAPLGRAGRGWRLNLAASPFLASEGFLIPTAVPGISGTNLIIFPEKLNARSRIEFRNPDSGRIERLSR